LASSAFLSSPASADTLPPIPFTGPVGAGSLYFSLGGLGQHFELPRWNSTITFQGDPNRNIFDFRTNLTGGGPAFTVGWATDFGPGVRPRFEIAFSFVHARSSKTATEGPTAMSERPIGGVPTGDYISNTVTSTLKTEHQPINAAFRFKTDFLVAPTIILTPGIGLLGGVTTTRFQFRANHVAPAGAFVSTIDERLQTSRIGGVASLDATFVLTPSFALHAGGSGAIYHQRTNLEGQDCYSALFGTECQPGGTVANTQTVNTSRSRLGGYASFSVGGSYVWGWAKITLVGNGQYNWNSAGVLNPTAAQPAGTTTSNRYDNTWNYGGFAMITFPLR
jgi:hypothetical protein